MITMKNVFYFILLILALACVIALDNWKMSPIEARKLTATHNPTNCLLIKH